MRDLLQRSAADEDGFTLVELLVTIVLLGIVGSMVTTSVVSASRAAIHSESRVEAVTRIHISMANLSREIRSAQSADSTSPDAALRVASPTALEFDLIRDGRRERIALSVVGNELRESRRRFTTAALTTPLPPAADRVLLRDLQGVATRPVFSYFNAAGTCIAGCASNLTATVSAAALPSIVEVRVVLRRAIAGGREPIEVETRISLRNS